MATRYAPREAPVPPLDPYRARTIEEAGAHLASLSPVGASLEGIDLRGERPADAVLAALEAEMANRGFIVFKEQQGLRIMHRATVKAPFEHFAPGHGLPQALDIGGANPFGQGVWQAGGIGFRWDATAPMQN